MSADHARTWIIKASLAAIGSLLVFLVSAPALGYPLAYDQALHVLEIVLPVFLAYVGSAAHFVFKQGKVTSRVRSRAMLGLLVRGPLAIFFVFCLVVLVVFGWSNRPSGAPGSGMSYDVLSAAVTAALGLLTVSTNVVVAYLFGGGGSNA